MSSSFFRENSLQDAFVKSLAAILANGRDVEGSFNTNRMTKELHPAIFEITNPFKRTLLCPKRGNNPFSTLAETMWVLSGRNDVAWLEKFLPRAKDFSDDGMVWRAGYGPRIRNWFDPSNGSVDQIDYVIKQLVRDPMNRQSIISIWDPAAECTVAKSKDYPCCDWVHFLWRDKKLDCTVVIRSNDAIWGFSSINMYEWTVLQEIIATIMGFEVGNYYQLSDSYHIYEPMYGKAKEILDEYIPFYTFNDLPAFRFTEEDYLIKAGTDFKLGTSIAKNRKDLIFNEIELVVQNVELEKPEYNLKLKNPQFNIINNLLVMFKLFGQESNKGSNVWYDFAPVMKEIPFSDLKVACAYWYKKNVMKIKDTGLELIQSCIEECR